jgi:hypothetical protein
MILCNDFLWFKFLWNFRNFILFFMFLFYTDLFRFTKSCILIEGYILVDLHFLVTRNVYPLILQHVTVTNKYFLMSGRVQCFPLFLWDVKKYRETKYSEMVELWLLICKHFLEFLVFKNLVGTFILRIHYRLHCFGPQMHRNITIMDHGLYFFHDCLILPFIYSILLRVIGSINLPLNPNFLAILLEFFLGEFTSIFL